jgi:hypothetical protein
MSGFVEGTDRSQSTLFPAMLDDYVAEDNLFVRLTLSLKALILANLALVVLRRWKKGGPPIIRRRCSRYTFTAISIAFRRAAAAADSVHHPDELHYSCDFCWR